MSISLFDDLGGLLPHFGQLSLLGLLIQSSEVERNPKMSISFFDDLGGLFLHFSHCLSLRSLGRSSEVEHNPKTSISFFLAGEGWQMGFESIDQPGRSSEVERNPKTSILFLWLERVGRWGLSPSTSPADHQKLKVIQK